ncbi:MAG: terpene cyclase/mutase family protein [candidate division WOR-3 bacterium]|nr:MAG: terpene cyclase/mutase family protein [candidate division WOR-3 bacterium]
MQNQLKIFLQQMPIDWLLSGEPFVQYRTLIDLLGKRESDGEVIEVKRHMSKHPLIREIFDKQNKDGYWGTPRDIFMWWPKKDTTFWLLGILADFGFTAEDRRVVRACEYVFSTQHPSGGFGCAPPLKPYDCFTGIMTETLAKLGYGNDARLKRAYEWLMQRQRVDGGFWCKNTGQPGGPRQRESSCAFATLCVLGALVQDDKLKKRAIVQRSAEFLLRCWENRGLIKYAGHDSDIGRGWEKLKYPFTDYRILKYLDVLSQCETVKKDPRMIAVMNMLIAKQDEHGRFSPESIHKAWSAFDFGQKEVPSRWITSFVYRIVKRIAR